MAAGPPRLIPKNPNSTVEAGLQLSFTCETSNSAAADVGKDEIVYELIKKSGNNPPLKFQENHDSELTTNAEDSAQYVCNVKINGTVSFTSNEVQITVFGKYIIICSSLCV